MILWNWFILLNISPDTSKEKKLKRKNVSLGGARTHKIDYFRAAHYSKMHFPYNEFILDFSIFYLNLCSASIFWQPGVYAGKVKKKFNFLKLLSFWPSKHYTPQSLITQNNISNQIYKVLFLFKLHSSSNWNLSQTEVKSCRPPSSPVWKIEKIIFFTFWFIFVHQSWNSTIERTLISKKLKMTDSVFIHNRKYMG